MIEVFAASLPQEGRRAPGANEDAFWIRPGDPAVFAVADGAGAADRAGHRVLKQLEALMAASSHDAIASFPNWSTWLRALDLGLSGSHAESTFAGVAVFPDRVVGATVGDSRAYLWKRDGGISLLAEGASKHRLGSGRIAASPVYSPIARGDIMLLLTDGAWTPFSLDRLRETIAQAALQPLAELPAAILRAASRPVAADDMTVVAARRR